MSERREQRRECPARADNGTVERYLSERLSPAEAERFEAHYLTCERCQESLRLGAAVRTALSESVAPSGGGAFGRFMPLAAGIATILAAGVAGALLFDAGPNAEIVRLGEVQQPPIYLGVPVRDTGVPVDSLFITAMRDYRARRYAEAVAGLGTIVDEQDNAVAAEFFLASSLLIRGRAEDAAALYQSVIEVGETPYLAEARFYLAKAFLQLGDGDEARVQLRNLTDRTDELGAGARALIQRLEGAELR